MDNVSDDLTQVLERGFSHSGASQLSLVSYFSLDGIMAVVNGRLLVALRIQWRRKVSEYTNCLLETALA